MKLDEKMCIFLSASELHLIYKIVKQIQRSQGITPLQTSALTACLVCNGRRQVLPSSMVSSRFVSRVGSHVEEI